MKRTIFGFMRALGAGLIAVAILQILDDIRFHREFVDLDRAPFVVLITFVSVSLLVGARRRPERHEDDVQGVAVSGVASTEGQGS